MQSYKIYSSRFKKESWSANNQWFIYKSPPRPGIYRLKLAVHIKIFTGYGDTLQKVSARLSDTPDLQQPWNELRTLQDPWARYKGIGYVVRYTWPSVAMIQINIFAGYWDKLQRLRPNWQIHMAFEGQKTNPDLCRTLKQVIKGSAKLSDTHVGEPRR